MPDNQGTESAISRRPARTYVGENDDIEQGSVGQGSSSSSSESRYGSADERSDPEKTKRKQCRNSSKGQSSVRSVSSSQTASLGRDLKDIFPATGDDRSKSIVKVLQAAKDHVTDNVSAGRPEHFGVVIPGFVYRSSFPIGENYDFVKGLGLKTVVTLVNKSYPSEYLPFLKTMGVRHIIIDMKGTKKVTIPEDIMRAVIRVTLDTRNHPVLLHCNHGKHRTGCVIAAIRHVAGWHVDDIVEEYSLFAEPKVRECDIKYINDFDVSILNGVFLTQPNQSVTDYAHKPKKSRFILAGIVFTIVCLVTTIYFKN